MLPNGALSINSQLALSRAGQACRSLAELILPDERPAHLFHHCAPGTGTTAEKIHQTVNLRSVKHTPGLKHVGEKKNCFAVH